MDIIQDRDNTHAPSDKFKELAETAQSLKEIYRLGLIETDKYLDHDMMESIDLICTKIARIVHGDSKHIDHWLDIAGYSQLIINRLQSEQMPPIAKKRTERVTNE
jgi:hypothetical protein